MVKRIHTVVAILALVTALTPAARAQWAVVDAPAIVQLIQQVQTLQQVLQTTRAQLAQAEHSLQTMTGDRRMEYLLSGTQRNYLPANWSQLTSAAQGAGGYPALAADTRSATAANAVLTPSQLAHFSATDQRVLAARRQSSALQQALAQESLANVSARFAALQSLIGAIAGAADQKAILDLQARIGAEVGMLQNEQTKQFVLHQATQAQGAANLQQELENAIVERGNFASRFQPAL